MKSLQTLEINGDKMKVPVPISSKCRYGQMDINTQDLIARLKEPFAVTEHKERKLPGGGRWFYIPWETIRDRLEALFPLDWTATYSDPVVVGDYTVIRCQLTILLSQGGITREGVGNDKAFPELNQQGKSKTIGTPPERARADAFKGAAEEFGIGAYLDDQKFVIRHMQTVGDSRAYKFAKENDWLDHGLPTANEGRSSDPISPVGKPMALSANGTSSQPPSVGIDPAPPDLGVPLQGATTPTKRQPANSQPIGSEAVDYPAPTAPSASIPEMNPVDVLEHISTELKRVGWTNTQGRDYLIKTYGKRSRQQLSETELWDFLIHLRSCSPVVADPF